MLNNSFSLLSDTEIMEKGSMRGRGFSLSFDEVMASSSNEMITIALMRGMHDLTPGCRPWCVQHWRGPVVSIHAAFSRHALFDGMAVEYYGFDLSVRRQARWLGARRETYDILLAFKS